MFPRTVCMTLLATISHSPSTDRTADSETSLILAKQSYLSCPAYEHDRSYVKDRIVAIPGFGDFPSSVDEGDVESDRHSYVTRTANV